MTAVSLVADGALALLVDPRVASLVAPWIPRGRDVARADARASIRVLPADGALGVSDDAPPLLALGGVRLLGAGDALRLRGETLAGELRLAEGVAHLHLVPRPDARAADEIEAALTICAALLVGRAGGALVHAAAVVDDDGAAWLLPGDSHAGKSTTCASLAGAGWRPLADDQVVLRPAPGGGVQVEGWARTPNLDEGWARREITGRRAPHAVEHWWGDGQPAPVRLRGVLLPAVSAAMPTRAARAGAAAALEALVRQSPWLLADPAVSGRVLALLAEAARGDVISLALGADSYGRGAVIIARIRDALGATTEARTAAVV